MSKDPAILWYPNDWNGGTDGWSFELKGAYIDLLMLQFNRGRMTLHMIGHKLGQNGGQIWDMIKSKFKEDENGLWYNERLEAEQKKRKAYTESRLNNKKGNNQHTKNDDETRSYDLDMTKHTAGRMVNVNVNVNKDKSINKIKYADFVLMTEAEYQKLISEHGEAKTKELITILNNYKGAKGKTYKSDYLAILNWVIDRHSETKNKKGTKIDYDKNANKIWETQN